jgi:hypothetical protein
LAASFTLPVLVFDFPQNLYTIHAVEGVRLFCTFSLLPIAILGWKPCATIIGNAVLRTSCVTASRPVRRAE